MAITVYSENAITEGGNIIVMARIYGPEGEIASVSDFLSASYSVYNLHRSTLNAVSRFRLEDAPTKVAGPIAVSIEEIIFDTIQYDMWSKDSEGYNLRLVVSRDNLPATAIEDWGHESMISGMIEVDLVFADGAGGERVNYIFKIQPSLKGKL